MSVAFRRESDEEHKEPRFELPIPPGPNLVTAAGLATVNRLPVLLLPGHTYATPRQGPLL